MVTTLVYVFINSVIHMYVVCVCFCRWLSYEQGRAALVDEQCGAGVCVHAWLSRSVEHEVRILCLLLGTLGLTVTHPYHSTTAQVPTLLFNMFF